MSWETIRRWFAKRRRPVCPRCSRRGRMNDPLKVVWTCVECGGWFNVDRPEVAGCVYYGSGIMWRTKEAKALHARKLMG